MSRRHLKYKVILLGNLGVGKTSMFRRLRDGSLRYNNDDNVNVSLDKHTKAFRVESGETVFLEIWDTAGMEGFRTVTGSYYRSAKVVVMVYDVTVRRSFYDLSTWMSEIQMFAPDAIPVLIGNKFDRQEDQDVDQKAVDDFAAANGIKLHFRVSVKDNQGVQEAFEEIAKYVCSGWNPEPALVLHDLEHSSAPRRSPCSGYCTSV